MLTVAALRYPLLVTIAYAVVYYLTMVNVAAVKNKLFSEYKAKGDKFDRYRTPDPRMLAADRIQLNMLEHMPLFLLLFWLTAVFVSPVRAAAYGAAYVVSRVAYPIMMGRQLGRNIPMRLLFATVTGYLAVSAFVVELLVVTLTR